MAEDASIESIHRNYEAIAAGANSSDSEEISASRRPTLTEESAASGSTYISDDALTRSTTATSKREPVFMPVRPGDTAELTRIATVIGRTKSAASAGHHEEGAELERKDTLYNVQLGDPVLDPTSTEFDVYKWAKMFMKLAHENNVVERRAGFTFKNLKVSGSGSAINLQKNVASVLLAPFRIGEFFSKGAEKTILNSFDGVLKSGEMLVVLGRPGSGCSTLLKTLTGELNGLHLDQESTIHYNGIPQQKMVKQFKGELVYNQEVDRHFPHLTVGETLEFAARVRTPQNRVGGLDREAYAKHTAQVAMAVFGLSHTYNTKVGNDFVRGVSGGERKRVSIAEMSLAASPIAAWDNSTRGLDAATALEFTRSLRMSANLGGSCHAVAIYQASQAIYNEFDKAVVLYEGRQIYFGPADAAKQFFVDMGYDCPARQTVGDFLTSVTNPQERKVRNGFERRVPRTPDDFEKYWKQSQSYKDLMLEIEEHEEEFPIGGEEAQRQFEESRKAMQSKHVRPESPYTVSIAKQVRYCTQRAYQRLWNDKTSTITTIVGQIVMALIIGSIFYGTPNTTQSFFQKGGVLFFAVLLNALIAITEINNLYDQRPIVVKQASFAFYHPFAEALAGIVSDIPVKFVISVCFNIILYFLAGLRREPAQFFIFFLFNFIAILTMSMIFRTIAASTKTISQALAIAGIAVLAIVIYTGYTIPRPYMHPWFKWISWINPVAYAFESLIVNELHGLTLECSAFVPTGPGYPQVGETFICSAAGAIAGQTSVSGDAYLESQFQYSYSHLWRNLGFLFAFMIFFLFAYMLATEYNSSSSSSAEVLVFRRGHVPPKLVNAKTAAKNDEEAPQATSITTGRDDAEQDWEQNNKVKALAPQTDVFSWRNVSYDIKIKGEPRRLLDNVSGWVKPGTLTALMGVSGAGKTTLLDVLAQRVSMGVITGDMLVSGKSLDESFQRKTGYVQQQDLHLETTTVREALRFSALLRQPKSVSKQEKYEFVEDVIKMLNMGDFAEAVVGVPGEGLNVEQRKLLTIGVELAAKPALLLFLDEPTSGLDSQSSWAIIAFLRKLADNGQAVLATIHQPSAILFQEFDRLLFLAKGGKTVYFGDIGPNSSTLLNYFSSNGADECGPDENPAEYMLTMVGAGPSGKSTKDWHETWKGSGEAKGIQSELDRIQQEMGHQRVTDDSSESHSEFAMPFSAQLIEVTKRVFEQYWRTPGYIYSKLLLGIASALFIGFSFFQADSSMQGLQNVIFSIFLLTSIFTTLVQQIMPRFITQRDLYEVRERPSKAYSWKAFLIANIVVEIPWQILLGVCVFASFYYPVFGIQSPDRQGLILLYCVQFFVFASSFAHMLIAALPDAETAGHIATLMFSLTLTFNGVFQPPDALPQFWIFMYRVSPLTYLVGGVVGTGLHDRAVQCASNELSVMQPPSGMSCGTYLAPYATAAGGAVYNPDAMSNCEYCAEVVADQFLASSRISFDQRWMNYGLGFAYIGFNIGMAVLLYYMIRVRKSSGQGIGQRLSSLFGIFTKSEKKRDGAGKKPAVLAPAAAAAAAA